MGTICTTRAKTEADLADLKSTFLEFCESHGKEDESAILVFDAAVCRFGRVSLERLWFQPRHNRRHKLGRMQRPFGPGLSSDKRQIDRRPCHRECSWRSF